MENVNSAFDSSLNFAQIWRQNLTKKFDENIRERRLLGSLLLCDLDYYYWISPVIWIWCLYLTLFIKGPHSIKHIFLFHWAINQCKNDDRLKTSGGLPPKG